MKKVILFLWFGDEKPPYIQWTLENFRKMNPGWEVRYIEYTTDQIKHYEKQNDPILAKSMTGLVVKYNNHLYNSLADKYRKNYLNEHKEELVVYCDLDCFPIAPFDNFVANESSCTSNWIINGYCKNQNGMFSLGSCTAKFGNVNMFKSDIWCICNNKSVTFTQFLQIRKGTTMDETTIFHKGMVMNEKDRDDYKRRNEAFHEMKIELGDSFCLPQFTPIEHYYSFERNKLNLNANV